MDFHRPWGHRRGESGEFEECIINCNVCHNRHEVSVEAADRWRREMQQRRDQHPMNRQLSLFAVPYLALQMARKGIRRINYGEIYVRCGERQDGRWNVIVIPLAGEREDIRIVQEDLEFMEAVKIAGQLISSGGNLCADDLLALCLRLSEAIKDARMIVD